MKAIAEHLGISGACRLLGMSRSTYYYAPREPTDDVALVAALRQETGRYPTYGYRRLTVMVRQHHTRDPWLGTGT